MRLLRTSTAAAATMIMTATPTAMYVVVGMALVGGGAMVADGEAVCVGVWTGATVCDGVVGETIGDTEDSATTKEVPGSGA